MTIYLGQSFRTPVLPAPAAPALGEEFLDGPGLLAYLEHHYGLGHPNVNRDALRTEQYRQLLAAHLAGAAAEPFYRASFVADALATAEELLSRRDELLDAGYPLHNPPAPGQDPPPRLAILHELEARLLEPDGEHELLPGPADRLNLLLPRLAERRHPRLKIHVYDPRHLLTPGLRRLLDALEAGGDTVSPVPAAPPPAGDSDLACWQRQLAAAADRPLPPAPLRGDGSLLLLRARRETHLAGYLARLLRDSADWRPGLLMTVRNQTLDNAIVMEGLPSLGVPSSSLARPSLQVLKLVTAFLWEPFEVQRIMEFVSLVTKPFDPVFAQDIAGYLADRPGLFGPDWDRMVGRFLGRARERNWPAERIRRARDQYAFFFERRRYRRSERVPKATVRTLFVFLFNWAREAADEADAPEGLGVLAAQCQRATELLDAQPETELGYLDVERLVRTVYAPAPASFGAAESGSLPLAYAAGALAHFPGLAQQPLEDLVWWDFVEQDPPYFFSRYYPPELSYLAERGVRLLGPTERNELAVWRNRRPALAPTGRLLLCLPERIDGEPTEPHPLLGDLEAAFAGDLAAITVDVDAAGRASAALATALAKPAYAPVPLRPLDAPAPLLRIDRPAAIRPRELETPTALEDLLYYPYKWVFSHQLKLRGNPILSIAGENRLRGNLSHYFVEQLLNEVRDRGGQWTRPMVDRWVAEHGQELLEQQGAVLLEYGQEPERVQFLRTIRYSAWTLLDHIQRGGWRIVGSEEAVDGKLDEFGLYPVQGRADLILEREGDGGAELAIVDLKWRGKTVFRNLLRNAEDIQLCLYAEFCRHRPGHPTVHTAYYLLRDALLLGRDEAAFAGIETVASSGTVEEVQRQTIARIRATHNWRWEQFAEGIVEVRCSETLPWLEDTYTDLDHAALLEMRTEDARFDDFRALVGLVR